MKRIAFFGGSFDPVHRGHMEIAGVLTRQFELDEFVLIPAFHAPHKSRRKPTSAFHRHAMLCLATRNDLTLKVSTMELEVPEKPYSIETLTQILADMPEDEIFFVIGADSWAEITTWKDWENVLTIVNIIVVTRPKYEIAFSHVTDVIQKRIVDLRNGQPKIQNGSQENRIFITDAVFTDVSSTRIRHAIRHRNPGWENLLSTETADYIKKYKLYQT